MDGLNGNGGGISSRQIRAARALLDWSQEDLATASGLSIATIRKLELGHISPRHSTTGVIRQAIENAGLEFIEPDGIRRRHEDITVYQGVDGLAIFIEDVQKTIRNKNGEVVIVASAESILFPAEQRDGHCRLFEQTLAVNGGATMKCLLTDTIGAPLSTPRLEFRSISRHFVDPIPFYVYGDKHAMIVPAAGTVPKVITVRSSIAAQAARRQFYSMWDMAMPVQIQPTKVEKGKQPRVYA